MAVSDFFTKPINLSLAQRRTVSSGVAFLEKRGAPNPVFTLPALAPPPPPPPPSGDLVTLTEEQRYAAIKDQVHVVTFGAFVSVAPVFAIIGGFIPDRPFSRKGVEFASGLHIKDTPKGLRPRLGLGTLTYLAPAPIGLVPPELYGMRPDYLDNTLNDALLLEFLGTKPTEARVKAYQADRINLLVNAPKEEYFSRYSGTTEERIRSLRLLFPFVDQDTRARERVNFGVMQLLYDADQLERLGLFTAADELNAVARSLYVVPVGFLPTSTSGVSPIVPYLGDTQDGAINTQAITPVSYAALAIMEGAEGLNRELATERADP